MFSTRRASALGILWALSGLLGVTSCLYDPDHRCDSGQRFDTDADLCVCDDQQNMVAGDLGCVQCAEHEVAANDVCSCAPGYTRPSAGAACTDFPPALGTPCEGDRDCPDATYNTCHLSNGNSGYCTNGCTDNAGCLGGYACDTAADAGYCLRPPSGQGQSCSTDADCAGTEATWCESFVSHACFVQGCSLTKNDCFPGKVCCDISKKSLGTMTNPICVDDGTCPTD